MKCLDDCHSYELDTFLEGPKNPFHLFFYKMDTRTGEKWDGVTNEEVIQVLIHRLRKLNEVMPCRENSIAITKLEEAEMWLDKRTIDRVARGVEGTGRP